MKNIFRLLTAAAILISVVSCGSKPKKALMPNISGKAGEVIVVIDKNEWNGAVGTVIRDTLADECPYLPQREPMYTLIDVVPSGFKTMFQVHRNILLVNIDKTVIEPGIKFKKDVWAAPQCVIQINAADSEQAVNIFKENSRTIIAYLEQAERDRVIMNAKRYEEIKLAPIVTQMVGGSPHFPSGYKLKKQTKDFIWITYKTQYTDQSVLIYKYPVVKGENMMDLDNILEKNAAVLKENVPGMFENTWMMTSPVIKPDIAYLNYKNRGFAEIRGLWEVHNDYMGGPFVAHAFYSQDGKDIIVLEAFVYAPKYDKRHYLRQVESVIYSFEWAKTEETDKVETEKE